MKKLLIISATICTCGAANALPSNWNQYAALRVGIGMMNNDIETDVLYITSTPTRYYGESEFDMSDFLLGGKIAYGLGMPIKYGRVRTELEFGGMLETSTSDTGNMFIAYTPVIMDYDIKTSAYTAMLNVYFDWDLGYRLVPYVGGGIGYAYTRSDVTMHAELPNGGRMNISRNDNASNFAFQLGAGVSYAATARLTIDAGYRFTDYGGTDMEFGGAVPNNPYIESDSDIYSHEFLFGMRYSF